MPALLVSAQEPVHFAAKDGWTINGDLYGTVVLVHGGRFTKAGWTKQAQAIAQAAFTVLAIDLRGAGLSKDGPPNKRNDIAMPLDLLAAIRFLQGNGAKSVSIVGAGMGGNLAEEALRLASAGEIDRVVFLAYGPPQALKGGPIRSGARTQGTLGSRRRRPRAVPFRNWSSRALDPRNHSVSGCPTVPPFKNSAFHPLTNEHGERQSEAPR